MLFRFGDVPCVRLSSRLQLTQLFDLANEMAYTPERMVRALPSTDFADACRLLVERAPMLYDYFSISISDDGYLEEVPAPIDNLMVGSAAPARLATGQLHSGALPALVVDLWSCVDWDDERACFDGVLRCVASAYARSWQMMHDVDGGIGTHARLAFLYV
jgi:hypothetical protein